MEGFRTHSTRLELKVSIGKANLATKVVVTVNMSCWVYCTHMQETKQQLKVVYILALATDTVFIISISDSVASYVLA